MDSKAILDVKITEAKEADLSMDKPLSFGSYLDLELSEEQKVLHTFNIIKVINALIDDPERKKEMDLAASYRNQYFGIVNETNFPWTGAFNLDIRITPKIQDAVVAQTQEAFDDVDPRWSVGPVANAEMKDIRKKQEKVLDYYEDLNMNNVEDLEAIRHDAYLLGLGWEATIFERKFERVKDFKIYNNLQKFMADFPDDFNKYQKQISDLQQGKVVKIFIEYNREVRRSPVRKHVEYEDVICPLTAKGVEGVNNSSIKARRVWMKWDDIKALEDDGDYIQGVSELLKYKTTLDANEQLIVDPEYLTRDFETFEVIYDMYLTIDGKKRRVRTMWNLEKEHNVCLRAIRYPYDHARSYLIPHCIQYTRPGLFQDGMGRKLQSIHIAGNAVINHVLNASVLANSLSLKCREGSDAARRILEHQWYPGSALELMNMDDAQQFQFSTPNLSSLISMFTLLERFGQDVSGIVNYQLGVESPDDPEAPASKTIALMRKAEIKLRRYIKNLKRSEDEVGYQAARLIYQFVPADRIAEILGEEVDETKSFLRPSMRIITNSTGFAIEKMFAKRDDMVMAGMLLKDPMIAGDPKKRSKLYYTIAQSTGSGWDQKIIGIVPTAEELKVQEEQAKAERDEKKKRAIGQTAKQVLEGGGSEEEAREAGTEAGRKFEALERRGQAMAQQEGGKK